MLGELRTIEASVSAERGAFEVFGLFRRRRGIHWELVVAAPWTGERTLPTIDLLVEQLRSVGGTPALLKVGSIVVQPDRSFIDAVHATVLVEHGLEVVGPGEYGNVEVARGYVITSREPAAVPA